MSDKPLKFNISVFDKTTEMRISNNFGATQNSTSKNIPKSFVNKIVHCIIHLLTF